VVQIWLTEPYYRGYRKRKGIVFHENEKTKLFAVTQELQRNWPRCATDPRVPPEVGTCARLYYIKCDFSKSKAVARVAFGCDSREHAEPRLVALTIRTKQELASGSKTGTAAWYEHVETVGLQRWLDYLRGRVQAWRIY
jgi:hypothetical protein